MPSANYPLWTVWLAALIGTNMKSIYVVSMRGIDGLALTSEVKVGDRESVAKLAQMVANARGATVDSVFPKDPIATLRAAVKECLGFVEAWQSHLNDGGNAAAARTVGYTLEGAREAYQFTANSQRQESSLTLTETPVIIAESQAAKSARIATLKKEIVPGTKVEVENGLHEILVQAVIEEVAQDYFWVKVGSSRIQSRWENAEIVLHPGNLPVLLDREHSYTSAI
jgi:hypothetical protein